MAVLDTLFDSRFFVDDDGGLGAGLSSTNPLLEAELSIRLRTNDHRVAADLAELRQIPNAAMGALPQQQRDRFYQSGRVNRAASGIYLG